LKTQPILAADAAPVIEAFAAANVLLAFDYDGTLAPIAANPARVKLRARTRSLLERVSGRYPSIVISGRALSDIAPRLQHIPLWYVFGNHGSEPAIDPAPLHQTDEWVRVLKRDLPRDPALVIENKGHSVTVHYRGADDRAALRQAIMEVATRLPNVRVVGGRQAVNLLRCDAPDKGWALRHALKAFACDVALYVGDDATDEDAFGSLPQDRLLSIRVGRPARTTRARFHLDSQEEIDALLELLLTLRTQSRILSAGRVGVHSRKLARER
jgi:trehalose 6-phosphate phosphatase